MFKWPCGVALLSAALLSACRSTDPSTAIGVRQQDDLRAPQSWRALTVEEQSSFDLGHAVFNTQWSPANHPAGRRDGIGPLFNSASCDSCHNSRRRGRGPRGNGEAPLDLVIQLGKRLADGSVQRGSDDYGFVLNTAAIQGATPEAVVRIQYTYLPYMLADGSSVDLYTPHYEISQLSGPPLSADTVIMPRMPPSVLGMGLLESVPARHIVQAAKRAAREHRNEARDGVRGAVSWIATSNGPVIGRFGWQASEPTIATQTATAFAREMGLTTELIGDIDCGRHDDACLHAPNGGQPEVEPALFTALVEFQRLHAVPNKRGEPMIVGAQLFDTLGCTACHRPALPVETASHGVIHAYTDLLLHDLGEALADRDLNGNPVKTLWRTAPLWGLQTAVQSGQPLRLLHDGRARSIEEAILWHGGEARSARQRYAQLVAVDRRLLIDWLSSL